MTTTVAATHKKIVMIESEADQVPENVMYEGIVQAHEHLQPVLDLIDKMVAEIGKPKFEYEHAAFDQELFDELVEKEFESMEHCMDTDDKNVREARVNEWITMVQEKYGEEHPDMMQYMDEILYKLQKKVVKKWLLAGKRVDGRQMNEIRPLAAEVGVIPVVHGSGLFTRGPEARHHLGRGREALHASLQHAFLLHRRGSCQPQHRPPRIRPRRTGREGSRSRHPRR